jgi:spermidine synthase
VKPTVQLAAARTPDGRSVTLSCHDGDYTIAVDGLVLMNSRMHASELELARLGCAHARNRATAQVLIGGLGMGYTLRQALDSLRPDARVLVAELLPEVVDWNRDRIGALAGHPLQDPRVEVRATGVAGVIAGAEAVFDAILLDVDNGPDALCDAHNAGLYSAQGIRAVLRALRPDGCLAVWSATTDSAFEASLRRERLAVRRFQFSIWPYSMDSARSASAPYSWACESRSQTLSGRVLGRVRRPCRTAADGWNNGEDSALRRGRLGPVTSTGPTGTPSPTLETAAVLGIAKAGQAL